MKWSVIMTQEPTLKDSKLKQALEPYPFETVEMHLVLAEIIPPIYNVKVTGETGSLDPIIKLIDTGKIEDGYVVLEVLGKDGIATGSAPYERRISISEVKDTKGVVLDGHKLDWNN